MPPDAAVASRRLVVRAGGHALAIDPAEVSEVVRLGPLTAVPLSPPALLGLASLRGRVAPVVSVARMLGETGELAAARRLVVLRRAEPIGLAVESVDSALGDQSDAELADLDALLRQAFADARTLQARPQAAVGAMAQALTAAPARRELALLSFVIAGQAYGLPLANVREVFRAPADLLKLAATDAAALGVTPHRGGVLAVVSPAALLGLGQSVVTERSSLVITALGGVSIGLLVDQVRSIVRIAEDQLRPVPAILNRGRGEAEVQAIARTAEGLVALLSPERLFDHRTVADVLAQTPTEAAPMPEVADTRYETFMIFRLGGETYGLPAAAVVEVVKLPDVLAPPPAASRVLAGVMNHRGLALPVIDPSTRLGLDPAGARRRVVVLDAGGQRCGLIVDAVEALTRLDPEQLALTSELAGAGAEVFAQAAIVEVDGRPVLFVDPAALLDDAERRLVGDLSRIAAEGA